MRLRCYDRNFTPTKLRRCEFIGINQLCGGGGIITDAFVLTITISASTNNYNLKTAAIAAGWNQIQPLIVGVIINNGVIIGSTSTATPAFTTDSAFPTGSSLSLTNNGTIQGKGGNGGNGGSSTVNNATAGGAGGPALNVSFAIVIDNTNGSILGGGGGGGGGGGCVGTDGTICGKDWCQTHMFGNSGGGGQGTQGGSGGPGASAGTSSSAGSSGGPSGGNGGAAGQAGANGSSQSCPCVAGCGVQPGKSGGAGGPAVNGNSYITWLGTGTRAGAIN